MTTTETKCDSPSFVRRPKLPSFNLEPKTKDDGAFDDYMGVLKTDWSKYISRTRRTSSSTSSPAATPKSLVSPPSFRSPPHEGSRPEHAIRRIHSLKILTGALDRSRPRVLREKYSPDFDIPSSASIATSIANTVDSPLNRGETLKSEPGSTNLNPNSTPGNSSYESTQCKPSAIENTLKIFSQEHNNAEQLRFGGNGSGNREVTSETMFHMLTKPGGIISHRRSNRKSDPTSAASKLDRKSKDEASTSKDAIGIASRGVKGDKSDNVTGDDDEGVGVSTGDLHPSFNTVYTSDTQSSSPSATTITRTTGMRHTPDVTKSSLKTSYSKSPDRKIGKVETVKFVPDSEHVLISPRSSVKRQQRATDITNSQTGKMANGRFYTHPPSCKSAVMEDGSIDSNGFGTINSPEGASCGPGNLEPQGSEMSLADSHLCPSEGSDVLSYGDVMQSVTHVGHEKLERKNSKTQKQKSKSDPSGEKQKKDYGIRGKLIIAGQSTPLLSDEQRDRVSDLPEFRHIKDDSKPRSMSDNVLSSEQAAISESGSESSVMSVSDSTASSLQSSTEVIASGSPLASLDRLSQKKRPRGPSGEFIEQEEKRGDKLLKCIGSDSVHSGHAQTLPRSITAPGIPLDEAQDKAGQLLTIPGVKQDIRRSVSSASVYATRRERHLEAHKNDRTKVVKEIITNESDYVDALKCMVEKYMVPLKSTSVIDSTLVDDIFNKIPELMNHHAAYFYALEALWRRWDDTKTIGDKIKAQFSKENLTNCYLQYIKNFSLSERVLENALENKNAFQKFIENCDKTNKNKLSLKNFIIKPIQKVPRLELLIKRLIKCTPEDHPDYKLLNEAENTVHNLALKIDQVNSKKDEGELQETLKKIEDILSVADLASPERVYLRYDMVNVMNRKEQTCCIWLFNDLVIFSTIKRKSGPVTRKNTVLLKSPTGQDFVDNIKHRLWLRVGLDDLEVIKTPGNLQKKASVDKAQLEEDFALLSQISELTNKLACQHQNLDEQVKELINLVNKQLSDFQLKSPPPEAPKLELLATTPSGFNHIVAIFPSDDKKKQWETAFTQAKNKLSGASYMEIANSGLRRPPDFSQALPITKTRAGMQFSCASPIDGLSANKHRDVWVCNSDGYVGHMCLLSLQPEPIVTLNTPVPGCNARILCICAVPGLMEKIMRRKGSVRARASTLPSNIRKPAAPSINIQAADDSSSSMDSSDDEDETDLDERTVGFKLEDQRSMSTSPKMSPGSSPRGSMQQLDLHKSTMWLGTEDGCILIFHSTDNIKTTKNKVKIQHSAGVLNIVHLESKVFVSLANGELVVYNRDGDGCWDTETYDMVTLGNASSPVTRILSVGGKLWCGCQNSVMILNPTSLNVEGSFTIGTDSNKSIHSMVCAGQGVWIATSNSSKVSLYHITTHEFLLEVCVAQAVKQKLQGADDIIRQHKTACLRITALLTCKDLLWVGTSAGVILTIHMPRICSNTTKSQITVPTATGLVHGHTGHVRFLTCVDMPAVVTHAKYSPANLKTDSVASTVRRTSTTAIPTLATKMLVVSGGDGYEDFISSGANEAAGRDDSTNHLLLWQV
ncbi:unnamed protein product [Owenia fusiformis]|uniref:Uncharacterized protein n=1 Tax=Owenia fusiformis TaxID=6347 RepID=A0A8J1TI16_OWEFU|nr:unnamed protein product [Owenia fusiformis]